MTATIKPKRKKAPSQQAAEQFASKKAADDVSRVPSKITHELIAKVCADHALGKDLQRACHENGISTIAWWKMLRTHRANGTGKEVLEAWDEARDHFTGAMEILAERLALSCDIRSPTMLIFMLKARKPEVYGERLNHSGKVDLGFPAHYASAMDRAMRGEQPSAGPAPH